ncbi:MAG: DUF3536 domain-containing protein [bacterium]
MDRHICIHGHFYQLPRANPWLEDVELQDSAYPYHDWNQRMTAECYAPNTASRILDPDRKIIDIVNNYSKMSFSFGPTFLIWLEKNDPDIYQAILEADTISRRHFSNHGSALAQCYNHMIMPLANQRDKKTQIVWGIRDFELRFGRYPEGMWLPETAVDLESLDIMAEEGIKFTILAPHQAKQVRRIGDDQWNDVSGERIDPKMPYICVLPSGRTIAVFFYDGPISRDIAFTDVLINGENFAERLLSGFSDQPYHQLLHVATDGETYGHYHDLGDMALAYCLYYIETNNLAKITVYGEYLESHPPEYEVEIFENSSWTCGHGIERWRSNCGCSMGEHPSWNQEWRAALRGAMDWLRDNLIHVYEEQISHFMIDPWKTRDDYITVVFNRAVKNVDYFFSHHARKELLHEEKINVLKLLEMQRHAMLMFTSSGWFFDDISGVEAIQVMQFAARAMQLANDVSHLSLEETFVSLLERAPSNIPKYQNGAKIYEEGVRPSILDLLRVGSHFAVSSLFEEYAESKIIYCYTLTNPIYKQEEAGKQKLAVGKVIVHSDITWEETIVHFAVLHLGDHNLVGGVREHMDEEQFVQMQGEIKDAFVKSDISRAIGIIEKYLESGNCSLWHLFKDEQRKVLYQILRETIHEMERSLRQINENHYSIIQIMRQLHAPLPKVLALTEEFILNTDLLNLLASEEVDRGRLQKLIEKIKEGSFVIDTTTINYLVGTKINAMMRVFADNMRNPSLLEEAESLLRILHPLSLDLDLWEAQNIYFSAGKQLRADMEKRAEKDDEEARLWMKYFHNLGDYLEVKII